jgi:hypothetical protein
VAGEERTLYILLDSVSALHTGVERSFFGTISHTCKIVFPLDRGKGGNREELEVEGTEIKFLDSHMLLTTRQYKPSNLCHWH